MESETLPLTFFALGERSVMIASCFTLGGEFFLGGKNEFR
jgi:hypothetical protein